MSLLLALLLAGGSFSYSPCANAEDIAAIDREISDVTERIRALPDGNAKANEMIALAERYGRKAHLLDPCAANEERERWEALARETRETEGRISHAILAATPSRQVSNHSWKNALAISAHVVKKYPSAPNMNDAYWTLALSYRAVGDHQKAISTFAEVERRDPARASAARRHREALEQPQSQDVRAE